MTNELNLSATSSNWLILHYVASKWPELESEFYNAVESVLQISSIRSGSDLFHGIILVAVTDGWTPAANVSSSCIAGIRGGQHCAQTLALSHNLPLVLLKDPHGSGVSTNSVLATTGTQGEHALGAKLKTGPILYFLPLSPVDENDACKCRVLRADIGL